MALPRRAGPTCFTAPTGASPGLPQGGAAVGLERSPVDVDLTPLVDHLQPACAFSGL
jgi:hypothetical protein